MVEKYNGRSSLATRGRFFLVLISILSCSQSLKATFPDESENEKIVEADSIKLFNDLKEDNTAKIYVTGDAQLTDLGNTITSPIIIIKDNKKEISKKKQKEKLKNNIAETKETVKKSAKKQPPTTKTYFSDPKDKEFNHFDVGLDKAVVTTTHQLKSFSINKLFIYSFVLLVSIYLVCFFKENTFFISIIGQNFQRPPPYFSTQLF